MINWLKTWWKQQERESDKEFDEYLKSCTVKDAKPCPFCGGEKVIIMQQGYYAKEYHVMCLNCGARNGIKFNKEIAIINWNLRMGDNNDQLD